MPVNDSVDEFKLDLALEQRIPLIIYETLILIFGLLGNSTVVYSTLRYNAIKLDKISLIFVQNLAIADILLALIGIMPMWLSYIAGRYVLGEVGCVITSQPTFVPWIMNSLLVLAVTAYRLAVASNPFLSMSKSTTRMICAGLWCTGISVLVIQLAYGSESAFEGHTGKCVSSIYKDEETAGIFLWYIIVLLSLTPLCLIILLNGALGVIAVRTSRSMRAKAHYKGLIMVCALSGLFTVSWLPWGVSTILTITGHPIKWPYMGLLAYQVVFINSVGNPILYTLTNRRFARFVTQMCMMRLAEWSPSSYLADSNQPPGHPSTASSTAASPAPRRVSRV